jgi:hypothetical protein
MIESVSVFRTGITPAWEDAKNKRGGEWRRRRRARFSFVLFLVCLLVFGVPHSHTLVPSSGVHPSHQASAASWSPTTSLTPPGWALSWT